MTNAAEYVEGYPRIWNAERNDLFGGYETNKYNPGFEYDGKFWFNFGPFYLRVR